LQRGGERRQAKKEVTFEDAVKHYGNLYGKDTFQGSYAMGVADSLYDDEDAKHAKLRNKVNRMH
jgi:hypothetical protein